MPPSLLAAGDAASDCAPSAFGLPEAVAAGARTKGCKERGPPGGTIIDDPSGHTWLGALCPGGLVSGRLRGNLIVWGSSTTPRPEDRGRSRPVSPRPEASPPCGCGARAGAGRLAAWSTIALAPLHGARVDRACGADVVPAAGPSEPLPHDPQACCPTADGGCVADLLTAAHPAHVPIRCSERVSDVEPTVLAPAQWPCKPGESRSPRRFLTRIASPGQRKVGVGGDARLPRRVSTSRHHGAASPSTRRPRAAGWSVTHPATGTSFFVVIEHRMFPVGLRK